MNEVNFCPRCGKRAMPSGVHTCAPQQALTANDQLRFALAEEQATTMQLLDLLAEFCHRVDIGEVRSKTTYAKFKQALSEATNDNPYLLEVIAKVLEEVDCHSNADDLRKGNWIPEAVKCKFTR